MLSKEQLSDEILNIFIQSLDERTRQIISKKPLDEIRQSLDLLPESLAPTGRILKYTLYDNIGKTSKKPSITDGVCAGFLFALDEGATVSEHEHPDKHQPTDTIEIYISQRLGMVDHLGNRLTTTPCLLGQKHGIGSMHQYDLVKTLKADRNHTSNIRVPSPYPSEEQTLKPNPGLDR